MVSLSEKRRPTFDLNAIKAAFATANGLQATGSAVRNAAALGFGRAEIVETIQSIHRTHFHKSMTSDADQRMWQDVYYVPSKVGRLYVTFTADAVTAFLLLSFQEKEHG